MPEFRKWFPVLVAIVLLMGIADSASAQPFSCFASSVTPPIVRSEGLAELGGDIRLDCSGNIPAGGIQANVQIFASHNITSRLIDTAPEPDVSEALFLIDEPGLGPDGLMGTGDDTPVLTAALVAPYSPPPATMADALKYTAWRGRWSAGAPNAITWFGVPLAGPNSTGNRVFRMTNLRFFANQFGAGGLIPTPIQVLVTISGAQTVPVANPQVTIATVRDSLDTTFTARTFQQCFSVNPSPGSGCPNPVGRIRFSELNFGTAWKIKENLAAPQDPSIPGVGYNSEGGFINRAALGNGTGTADNATRLMARFGTDTNPVPPGVSIFVTVNHVARTSTGVPIVTAQLVSAQSGGSDVGGGNSACLGQNIAPITISGGKGEAVWEIRTTDPFALESISFDVVISATANPGAGLPGLGTAQATGSYAPLSTVVVASASAPIPRFADIGKTGNLFTINACRTLILFPFVTNVAGFDTGIAISNTSLDPFGTSPQMGACDLFWFGNFPATGAPAPAAPTTTPVIAGGEQLAFIMSSGGGVVGTTKACPQCAIPGFQGYMIANCAFQYAHAYAFVSDLGAQRLAQGYLALIIPDQSSRPANPVSVAGAGTGEQLVH